MAGFEFEQSIKKFMLDESCKKEPSMQGYLHALGESLRNFSPKSNSDQQRLEMAVEALRGVKRHARRMHERNVTLEEENKGLQERLLEESGEK